MKQVSLLKTLVQILIVLAGIIIFFAVPFILISCFMPETIPFKINGMPAAEIPLIQKILMLIAVGGGCCFVYALIVFKQVLALFEKKKVFHDDVISNLTKTGKFILTGYAILGICTVVAALTEGTVSLNFNFIMNSVFAIGLGLFFLVLAHAFRMAKAIKEENNLTV